MFLAAAVVVPCVTAGAQRGKKPGGEKGPEFPIGVVDVVTVFNEYDRAKDLTKDLNKARADLEAKANEKRRELEALKEKVEQADVDSAEGRQLKAAFDRKVIEWQAWGQGEKAKLVSHHQALTLEMYKEAVAAIERVARDRGLLLVLTKDRFDESHSNIQTLISNIAGRNVLYAHGSVDITQDVLKSLNAAYKKARPTTGPKAPPKDPL